jgi:Ca-activated chloride channel family protein
MQSRRQQKTFTVAMALVLAILVAAIIQRVLSGGADSSGSEQNGRNATAVMAQATLTAVASNPSQVAVEIASSNTKESWLNAVIANFNAEGHTITSGETVFVQATHGTSGGTQLDILDGELRPTVWSPGDYSWVETANEVWRDRTGRLLVSDDCPQTTLAPIGLAMWRPMAEALGWPDTPIGWSDLIELMADPDGWASVGHPEWGTFKFGHTHPDYSNVGLLMLASLAYLATDKTEGVTADDVYAPEVVEAFRQMELNTYHYGIQSRDLLGLMVARGPEYLHAVTTSEAETLKTNAEQGENMRFPLVFVFPSDGTFWGEHPYCVLDADWVSDQQREAAAVFLDYLLDPAQQALAVDNYLRPVDASIPLHAPLALENGTDPRVTTATVPGLEIPSSDVANAVKDVFHQTKKPAAIILVLDTSGSMNGDKIVNAAQSAINFVGRLDGNDTIYALGFGNSPYLIGDGGMVSQVGESLTTTMGGVYAEGGTALHDAVCQAITLVDGLRADDEAGNDPHLYGIVLLSDGRDTASQNSENQMFNCLPSGESVEGVRVFTIAYGQDANPDLMCRIAGRTNGRCFTGGTEDIERIYNAISAEQ